MREGSWRENGEYKSLGTKMMLSKLERVCVRKKVNINCRKVIVSCPLPCKRMKSPCLILSNFMTFFRETLITVSSEFLQLVRNLLKYLE